MALLMRLNYHALPLLRRERVFKDQNNPLDMYTDEEVFSRFRCPRCELLTIIDEEKKTRENLQAITIKLSDGTPVFSMKVAVHRRSPRQL